ncbi:hypothetical protein V3C99_001615 [Haemonchus contortus]
MFSWQTWILTVVAAMTIPLYIRILYVLIRYKHKYRFSSHFYTITISQGFIDVIGFVCYYTSVNMREIDALKSFYWSLNWTIFVQWSYTQTYLFEYARILGVMMISIQRCLTVSFPHSRFNQTLIRLPAWSLFVFQCTVPIPFIANMFFLPMYFDSKATMNVVIDRHALEVHYLKAALIPLVASITCAVAYGNIINTIRKSTGQLGFRRRRDIRLSIQAVGLLVALLITCVHFCMQYTFNILKMTSQVYMMRLFTPLWVGMLTFINPWMILLMNQEVRRMTLGKHMSEDSSSVHPAVASQQFTRTATKKPTLYEKE